MDYQIVLLTLHLLGFALGVGGATISDVTFFKSLKDKKISDQEFDSFKTLSNIIWIGLIILILSGLGLFTLIYMKQGSLPLLASPRWQAKLIMVAIVLINGFVFMKKVFPLLKSLVNQQLTPTLVESKLWLLAVTGTVSIVSWYSIFLVSVLPRTVRPALYYFLGAYFILIVAGAIVSRYLLKRRLQG